VRQKARLQTEDADMLLPVPLHRWRLWSRGFNQAALIANALTRVSGIAHDPLLLRRVKATPPLRAMGAKARARAVAGVFRVIDPKAQLPGKAVVLIDDIYTSGATTDGCTAALLRAMGAKARARAVAGVFRVIDPKAQLPGKAVVLIDDIYTSGATTDGCTAALLRAGAAKVTILCWARVIDSKD
jgi:predicted amidophosphoribosyltransferase